VQVGDLIRSKDLWWDGLAIVVKVNDNTAPPLLTVQFLNDSKQFATTIDDAEIVSNYQNFKVQGERVHLERQRDVAMSQVPRGLDPRPRPSRENRR